MNPEDYTALIKQRGKPKKQVSLIFLFNEGKVLLGRKKHKFALGKLNGPGGKQESGETIGQCALNELEAESGLVAQESDLIKIGEVDFYFLEKPEWDQTVHVYRIDKYLGEPKEVSDEIGEWQWYPIDNVPFNEMWESDKIWWPPLLQGKKLKAKIIYGPGEKTEENLVLYKELKEG